MKLEQQTNLYEISQYSFKNKEHVSLTEVDTSRVQYSSYFPKSYKFITEQDAEILCPVINKILENEPTGIFTTQVRKEFERFTIKVDFDHCFVRIFTPLNYYTLTLEDDDFYRKTVYTIRSFFKRNLYYEITLTEEASKKIKSLESYYNIDLDGQILGKTGRCKKAYFYSPFPLNEKLI